MQGFARLTLGTIDEKFALVFKMLDFSNSGAIRRQDCQLVLQHIPPGGFEDSHLALAER